MSILDDILRDMEAGTPGPWRAEQPHFANGWWVVFTDPDTDGTVDESGDGGFEEVTARRIARVPQLEQIALAAEGCANWCDVLIEAVLCTSCAPDDPEAFEDAIRGAQMFAAALRKAMEAAE